MSPEERQLIAGLFERIKSAASTPRDQQAEAFINEQVKAQPAAPYLLAQTVIVQDQALQGANARIEELEARVQELESKPAGSFLGGLFGGGRPAPQRPPQPQARPNGPWGPQPGMNPVAGGYAPQGWGQQQPPTSDSGGFLRGALGTAAGVAGGVLLADGIRSLFTHGAGYGGMANLGIGSGFTPTGGDTVINNYYGDQSGATDAGYDAGYDDRAGAQDADYDSGYDDGGGFDSGGDGGFDV
ncbi:DUF2076 domain-containing protein [Methylocystis sp. B8]|uniref:DUF2076 domain-containing protein n=1 Tax=Methylocystis sp. B8 TaxID=544938 RepID=UPI0010FD1A75|nr:DUF2076 domain-containing protein [Methylocystis sp. B8]TLG79188.1 DUF2076 domain-containing protein [Methylocystis sp. B8]